jgi:hypothetical protein
MLFILARPCHYIVTTAMCGDFIWRDGAPRGGAHSPARAARHHAAVPPFHPPMQKQTRTHAPKSRDACVTSTCISCQYSTLKDLDNWRPRGGNSDGVLELNSDNRYSLRMRPEIYQRVSSDVSAVGLCNHTKYCKSVTITSKPARLKLALYGTSLFFLHQSPNHVPMTLSPYPSFLRVRPALGLHG